MGGVEFFRGGVLVPDVVDAPLHGVTSTVNTALAKAGKVEGRLTGRFAGDCADIEADAADVLALLNDYG